jgi:hypothetical protein
MENSLLNTGRRAAARALIVRRFVIWSTATKIVWASRCKSLRRDPRRRRILRLAFPGGSPRL